MKPIPVIFCTDGIFPHTVGGMQRHSRLLVEALARTGAVALAHRPERPRTAWRARVAVGNRMTCCEPMTLPTPLRRALSDPYQLTSTFANECLLTITSML